MKGSKVVNGDISNLSELEMLNRTVVQTSGVFVSWLHIKIIKNKKHILKHLIAVFILYVRHFFSEYSIPLFPSCPYLHRTTGDTERKYHLRYYKTGTCIHETDARGHCVKNGLHCAFAHGPHDLRPPVYDIRWHAKQILARCLWLPWFSQSSCVMEKKQIRKLNITEYKEENWEYCNTIIYLIC